MALEVVEKVHIGAVAAAQAMLELGQELKGVPYELSKLRRGADSNDPAKEKAFTLSHPRVL